jgi:WD40 repeat protein
MTNDPMKQQMKAKLMIQNRNISSNTPGRKKLNPLPGLVLFALASILGPGVGFSATNGVRSDILTLPASYAAGSVEFSTDGAHYAYATGPNGGQTIVRDGAVVQPTGNIGLPFFSPSGKLFFWIISNGLANLYADGAIVPTKFGANNEVVFSQDGTHWAALGGERLAQGDARTVKLPAMLYVDGKLIGKYDDFSYPDFSPDGKHCAFLALDSDERMSLVVDGQTIKQFEKPKVESSFIFRTTVPGPNLIKQAAVHYLTDGKLLLLVRDAAGWTVYRDDKALASYPGEIWGGGGYAIHRLDFKGSAGAAWMQFQSLALAKEAPSAAWWEQPAGQSNSWRVVVDGSPADSIVTSSFWAPTRPILSASGKRVAYIADFASQGSKKIEAFVVVDGKKTGPYANVWGMRFSADGKHLSYAATDGSDGASWAYYLDDKAMGGKFDSVYPPSLSADGAHIAWTAERDKKTILVADGTEIGSAEEVLWGPNLSEPGVIKWVVRDGLKVVRVTVGGK